MSDYELHHGDCLEVMPNLQINSIHCIFADLPYGITSASWERPIDLSLFWKHARSCGTAGVTSVFTATQPYATDLIISNRRRFRHELIWCKTTTSCHLQVRHRPMRAHENVLVFREGKGTYNPQMREGSSNVGADATRASTLWQTAKNSVGRKRQARYPISRLQFGEPARMPDRVHPTQKPLALLEWIIASYTNAGDTVLDPVMGSGTTGVACARLGRKFIGIEKDATYFAAGKARIKQAYAEAAAGPLQRAVAI